MNYARVVSSTNLELVKASVAKFNTEELILHTKRQTARGIIAQAIGNTPSSNNIQVKNVFTTDYNISDAFAFQFEQKVVAFQKVSN